MLLYFIRHGQTDWNREKRVMGRLKVPVNKTGGEEARRTAEFLSDEGIEIIYSGTLKRTRQTADILSDVLRVNIREDPRLDESSFENWVGKTYKDLKDDPDFKLYTEKPTRSAFSEHEDIEGITKRAVEFIDDLSLKEEGRAAIVSHSDIIKPVITTFLKMDLDMMHRITIANASVTLVDKRRAPRVIYMNLTPWRML
ncbi:MAG: histidine phosphatase family protein [Candidatus Krumholzibacteriota bacterium]|nr:histidine phosphatase family protein [Candidatus Krumholzibacteriota bacterium]